MAGNPAMLTYCDEATGERVELTAAALGDWSARAAALLTDGCGLGAGRRVAVLLPPHWLTAAALLGAWAGGLQVSLRPRATAGLAQVGPGADAPIDVALVAADRIGSWLEDVPAAPHRFSFFAETPPEGYRDFLAEAAAYPPDAPAYQRNRPEDAASVDGTSYGEWGALAGGMAERIGLRAGDRLLVDAAEHEHPVKWLLAPLFAGASVVVCAGAEPGSLRSRAEREEATHTLL